MLRARLADGPSAVVNPVVPTYIVRRVSDLPSDFQAPDWQHRNPTPARDRPATKRSLSPCKANLGAHDNAVRSILNTCTIEKFEELLEQLVTSGIHKLEDISVLMMEIFDKATTQHHFIPMYADLCSRLEQDSHIKEVVGGHQQIFRRLLLNQCQIAFDHLFMPSDEEQMSNEEISLSRKQQALGNMKLIGHLLVRGVLTSEMLVKCAEELLYKRESCPE